MKAPRVLKPRLKQRPREHKVVLHAGCGPQGNSDLPNVFNKYKRIRLDIDSSVKPDIEASITSMPMIKTASMDAVSCLHCLEHLYPHDVPKALAEFKRVLKPKGFVMLLVPDLQSIGQHIADGELTATLFDTHYTRLVGSPTTPLDILYGYRPALATGKIHMAHHTGFSGKTLTQALAYAGFGASHISVRDFNILALAAVEKKVSKDIQKVQESLDMLTF